MLVYYRIIINKAIFTYAAFSFDLQIASRYSIFSLFSPPIRPIFCQIIFSVLKYFIISYDAVCLARVFTCTPSALLSVQDITNVNFYLWCGNVNWRNLIGMIGKLKLLRGML
jgi:hypothetical protein